VHPDHRLRDGSKSSTGYPEAIYDKSLAQSGNATEQNIAEDFSRLVIGLDLRAADPYNKRRLDDLKDLSTLRNIAAHHKPLAPASFPTLTTIRTWKNSCAALATSFDQILYDELSTILGHQPWMS
jgi:hypothetical protein